MRKYRNIRKRTIAVILTLACLIGLVCAPVEAREDRWGWGTGSATFTVKTKSTWYRPGRESVTLKNYKIRYDKRVFKFFGWKWVSQTKSAYPVWEISVVSTDRKHCYKTTMRGSRKKLRLRRNKTYRITVRYKGLSRAGKCRPKNKPRWSAVGIWRATGN